MASQHPPAFLTVHPKPALASYKSSAKHVSGQHKAQECPTAIERATNLDIYLDPMRERKSGIICTIGPACIDVLDQLQTAGMNVVRMNFSHGDYEVFSFFVLFMLLLFFLISFF